MGGSRSHSELFCVENRPKIALKPVLIFWSSIPCVFCLYRAYVLLKIVGYYDGYNCSFHVNDGFPKKKFG